MIAVEVPEPYGPIKRLGDVGGCEIAHVGLDGGVAVTRETKPRAMRMEQVPQTIVGPVEGVDAERTLAGRKTERHGDEEAPLERADLRDVARDAEFALAADHMPADRRGERRGHAAHGLVALRDIAVDRRIA